MTRVVADVREAKSEMKEKARRTSALEQWHNNPPLAHTF